MPCLKWQRCNRKYKSIAARQKIRTRNYKTSQFQYKNKTFDVAYSCNDWRQHKTNSTEYLTYRLKQNMPLANDENVLSQILEK